MSHSDSLGPDDRDLTPRRLRIVQFIAESVRRNGYSPSLREIGEAVGLASTSSVSYQLSKLKAQGRVVREPGRPRTTKLRPQRDRVTHRQDVPGPVQSASAGGEALAEVPFVGRIAAGKPTTATELPDDAISLPRLLVGHGDLMMLTVAGDSMTGAAIADGDWVVVRRQKDAENGEIVAAELDSDTADGTEATVKTYRKRDGHAWLIPHNPAFTPIPGDNAKIIGKVVAVLRRV